MKNIILFGSGAFGLKALEYFGNVSVGGGVYALCDNGCKETGTKYGVLYIPFEQLIDIYREYIIIVSTNVSNSREIAEQLLDNDIDDFIILDKSIWHEMSLYAPEDYISILNLNP